MSRNIKIDIKKSPNYCSETLEAPPGFGPGVKELQSFALPLGYSAVDVFLCNRKKHMCRLLPTQPKCTEKKWSGLRGSNSLPPPWQGGALPDELNPHIGDPKETRTLDLRRDRAAF